MGELKYNERSFRIYRPMRELTKQFSSAYDKQLAKMVSEIVKFVETQIVLGSLDKAAPKKPVATPSQLKSITELIEDYHQAFIAGTIGADQLRPEDVQRLIDAGILPQDLAYTFQPGAKELPPLAMQAIEDAYRYGHVLASARTLDEKRLRNKMSYEEFVTDWAPQRRLSENENHALEWLKHSAATEITGLGRRIADDFSTAAVEADADLRRRYMGLIRDELESNVRHRETWRGLAQELGKKTGDWSRDFRRIAASEKQRAVQEGQAAGLVREYGDPDDVNVAKQPSPGACADCVRLHYTGGEGSPLRIFKLADLIANGTNFGKKRPAWEAVVGTVHPWCFPPGTGIHRDGGWVPIETIREGDLVQTHQGRLRAVQRLSQRVFSGDLVVLRCGDKRLEVTPEHPLLTSRGWVLAGDVQLGDDLMKIPQRTAPHAESDNRPAEDREIAFLSSVLRTFSLRGVPVWVDFHDQAVVREPNIRIERADRHLWKAFVAGLCERVESERLEWRERSMLFECLSRLDLLGDGAWLSTESAMGILSESLSIFRGAFGRYEEALLANGTDGHAGIRESAGDSPAGCSVAFRDLFDAIAAFVESNDGGHGEGESFHDVAYHGVAVRAIERRAYVGPVFNFSVEEDESYVAEGFVAHNCGCELIHVPEGMTFDADGDLTFAELTRSDWLEWDLRKAIKPKPEGGGHLTYDKTTPDKGMVVRVGDPLMRQAIDKVLANTPAEIFDKRVGVTFITTDIPRVQNPFDDADFAYWTGNEIRIMQTLPYTMIARVLPHEIGHSLNIHLIHTLGSVSKVRAWHKRLWRVSKDEGYVSEYAKKLPIENAAEVTMYYLYHRQKLMLRWPRQFAFVHKAYRAIWKQAEAA